MKTLKHAPKRYTGVLTCPLWMTRADAALELKKWRKTARVRTARYTNGNIYQSTDEFNPYKLTIAAD